MTPSEVEAIAAADNATVVILNALIAYLEKQGVFRRDDFAAFLAAAMEGWRAQGADERLMRLVAIKARAMSLDPPPSVQN